MWFKRILFLNFNFLFIRTNVFPIVSDFSVTKKVLEKKRKKERKKEKEKIQFHLYSHAKQSGVSVTAELSREPPVGDNPANPLTILFLVFHPLPPPNTECVNDHLGNIVDQRCFPRVQHLILINLQFRITR